MTIRKDDSNSYGQRPDGHYADAPAPNSYPYEEVAWDFIEQGDERGLGHDERVRVLADMFGRVSADAAGDGLFDSHSLAWLALGYVIEMAEDGVQVLTDEEVKALVLVELTVCLLGFRHTFHSRRLN